MYKEAACPYLYPQKKVLGMYCCRCIPAPEICPVLLVVNLHPEVPDLTDSELAGQFSMHVEMRLRLQRSNDAKRDYLSIHIYWDSI